MPRNRGAILRALSGRQARRAFGTAARLVLLLVFSLAGLLFTYAVLRLQALLPLNPQKLGSLRPDLAFNTAASFATNTDWQNYAGETALSYFSQMVGLVFHHFVSAAVGIAAAAALVRGLARRSAKTESRGSVSSVRRNFRACSGVSASTS